MLASGDVPEGFSDISMSLLLKIPKVGNPIRTRLEGYRKICSILALHKMLKLILANRCQHLVTGGADPVVTPVHKGQMGFREFCSTEGALYPFLESVREFMLGPCRPAQAGGLHILLIDLLQAYDRVWLEALFVKLEYKGLSPRLIRLLRNIVKKCKTRVMVNGVLSEPMEVGSGVLTGDPLSCALFLFFIDDLPRYLESVVELRSVENLLGLLLQLLFADDYGALLASSAAAQIAAFHIVRWGSFWRLSINTAMGKSNVMRLYRALPPPGGRDHILLEGMRILFTDSYKYLGVTISQASASSPFVPPASLLGTFGPFYGKLHRSDFLRKLPLSRLNSVLRMHFHAYAEAVLRYGGDALATLQSVQVSAQLAVLRLPFKNTLSSLWVCSMLGHPTSEGHVARAMFRFFQGMILSPLHLLPAAEKPVFLQTYKRLSERRVVGTLTDDWHAKMAEWQSRRMLHQPLPSHPDDVTAYAEALSRVISYDSARALASTPKYRVSRHISSVVRDLPPLVEGTFIHLISLSFGFPASNAEMCDPQGPPLCYMGPGCRSLVAECSVKNAKLVLLAQAGAICMWYPPFRLPPRVPGMAHPVPNLAFVNLTRYPCEICPAGVSVLDVAQDSLHHMLLECPLLLQVRRAALASLPDALIAIFDSVEKLNSASLAEYGLPEAEEGARLDIHGYFHRPSTTVGEVHFLFYRLVMGAPWPPSALVHRTSWLLARALAFTLLHSRISVRFGDRLADKWIPWSQQVLQAFLDARLAIFRGL